MSLREGGRLYAIRGCSGNTFRRRLCAYYRPVFGNDFLEIRKVRVVSDDKRDAVIVLSFLLVCKSGTAWRLFGSSSDLICDILGSVATIFKLLCEFIGSGFKIGVF